MKRAGTLAVLLVALALAIGGCGHSSKPTSALDRFKKILGHAPTGVAREIAVKRAGQLRSYDRETAVRRLSAFLMRRGYSGSTVRAAVEHALPATPGSSVRFR